uniref:Uncharacterized protein n=1 Tax=Oryza barthii TaxID=65489 RepID=A0A0D3EP15_9ORYZ
MVAATPAISGEGGWPGENQGCKGSMVVAAARPRAAWSGGAPYSRQRPNRAATPAMFRRWIGWGKRGERDYSAFF